MKKQLLVTPESILIFVTILAGLGWIFSKEALAGLPPIFFIGLRFLLGGFILVLVGFKYFRNLTWKDTKLAFWMGIIMGVAMIFWVTGLDKSSNLGVGAFIASLGVVLVPVLAKLMFGENPPRNIWLALPVAIIGLGFLAINAQLRFEIGHLLFFLAAIAFAFQFNFISRYSTRMHFYVLTSIQLIIAGVLMLCVSFVFEEFPETISLEIFGWFWASTIIGTCMRFVLQTYGQSLTPASHAAVIMNLEPVWAALFAAVWFGETMLFTQVIGCCLVFVAMLISRWTQIRRLFKS